MPYQSDTIQAIISRINTQYFLPAIQRNYRWKPDQVRLLFDSVLRGYPISSFLFWRLTEENREKWEIFKFCEVAYSGGTRHIKQPTVHGAHDLVLVLDGQQRLTSLFIALKGIYKIRRPRQWSNWPQSYPDNRLFLDLLAAPNEIDKDEEISTIEPYYSLKFFETAPVNQSGHFWFPVGRILDCGDSVSAFKRQVKSQLPQETTPEMLDHFEDNLDRLYQAIWNDPTISYYEERVQDYDRVLDIFVRANEGGSPLTSDEIILSMFESKWSGGAKEKIYKLIDHANHHLPGNGNMGINQGFIMRACLVLADMPVRYMVKNFTNQNIEQIEHLWPQIKDAILRTLTLVTKLGFNSSNFRRLNLLIPVVYYFFKNPEINFLGTDVFQVRNADRIRRWLIVSLLNNVLGERQQQALANLRTVLKQFPKGADFPVEALNQELERMGFRVEWNERTVRAYLDSKYQVDFFKLTLIYEDRFWQGVEVHQDHIFPKKLFDASNPVFAALPVEKQECFLALMNNLANLEILLGDENREKQGKPFDQWISTRDRGFRQRHLIPDGDHILQFENFDQFIAAREELIKARLQMAI